MTDYTLSTISLNGKTHIVKARVKITVEDLEIIAPSGEVLSDLSFQARNDARRNVVSEASWQLVSLWKEALYEGSNADS